MRPAAQRLGILAVLALVGCGEGPSELTIVDELRVLNLAVEPASPAPGEVPEIDLLVADPEAAGYDTWTWWCVGDVCGDGALPDGEVARFAGLACAPGACDGPGELDDPDAWLADLGFTGVSFVRRTVPLSPSAQARINANPVIGPVDVLPEVVPTASTIPLAFRVDDADVLDPLAFGYATVGGFRVAVGRPVVDGTVVLELVTPETPGEGEIFVVVEDGLGGSASFTAPIRVE